MLDQTNLENSAMEYEETLPTSIIRKQIADLGAALATLRPFIDPDLAAEIDKITGRITGRIGPLPWSADTAMRDMWAELHKTTDERPQALLRRHLQAAFDAGRAAR